jgi:uncharacterized membrane protein YjjP (DUF1212 family)
MFRGIFDRLLKHGLWFATVMVHIMSAGITVLAYLIPAIVIRWFEKNT